jgi:hypothetical protein
MCSRRVTRARAIISSRVNRCPEPADRAGAIMTIVPGAS